MTTFRYLAGIPILVTSEVFRVAGDVCFGIGLIVVGRN